MMYSSFQKIKKDNSHKTNDMLITLQKSKIIAPLFLFSIPAHSDFHLED